MKRHLKAWLDERFIEAVRRGKPVMAAFYEYASAVLWSTEVKHDPPGND